MKLRTGWLVLLMCFPLLAQAQGFKCKQPDGSLSFQEQPCPAGTVSSAMPSAPGTSGIGGPAIQPQGAARASGRADPRQAQWQEQDREREKQRRQADEEINKQNQEARAYNKSLRCNAARSQLGIAKEHRPIFSRDNKGDRQYVEDKNRPAAIAAAEQRVAEECN